MNTNNDNLIKQVLKIICNTYYIIYLFCLISTLVFDKYDICHRHLG